MVEDMLKETQIWMRGNLLIQVHKKESAFISAAWVITKALQVEPHGEARPQRDGCS